MKNERIEAGFGTLTEDEQAGLVGGDGFWYAVGWAIGYAAGTMQQALIFDYKVVTGQPIAYIDGKGFI